MARKEYKVGDRLTFNGVKIQITSVNSDGTANFSEFNPATKTLKPFSTGMQGKLPSLSQASADKVNLTTFEDDDVDSGSVSVAEYSSSEESVKVLPFVNLSGFKKFLKENAGKAVLTLTEADEITIVGNLGNTVIKHKALNVPRTVDKVNTTGFYLGGSFMSWGRADQWAFQKDYAVWTSEDGQMHLAYKISGV